MEIVIPPKSTSLTPYSAMVGRWGGAIKPKILCANFPQEQLNQTEQTE